MILQVIFLIFAAETKKKMENNLNRIVRELCRVQGMTMKELATKMGIAPESLSRAINGNPQLSTLENIAKNLNVSVAELFGKKMEVSELSAMVYFRGETIATTDLDVLTDYVNYINDIKRREFEES